MRPKTLDEAVQILEGRFTEKERATFLSKSNAYFHHGFGTSIRNEFGLWDQDSYLHKWFIDRGFVHPDDFCSIILKSLRAKLEDRLPIDLVEEAQRCASFWEKSAKIEGNLAKGESVMIQLSRDGSLGISIGL